MPYSPLATIQAGVARVEGRPGDRPYGDGGEGLTGSDDSPAPTKTSHGDYWQWQRCSPGRSKRELGTDVPGDFPAAANASGSREEGQPGDGIHCDDGERLAGSGLPRRQQMPWPCGASAPRRCGLALADSGPEVSRLFWVRLYPLISAQFSACCGSRAVPPPPPLGPLGRRRGLQLPPCL